MVCPHDGNLLTCASSNALYASDDAGLNWYRVSTDFGGVNDLVQTGDLSFDEGILIATADEGVWHWDWNWTPYQLFGEFGESETTCVEDFAFDQFIYAGTDGSAVWNRYYGLGVEEGGGIEIENPVFSIHPNPATDNQVSAVITLNYPPETSISVFDITGRLISTPHSGLLEAGEHTISLDVFPFPPGMYFARLQTDRTTASVKFLVVD